MLNLILWAVIGLICVMAGFVLGFFAALAIDDKYLMITFENRNDKKPDKVKN